MQDRLWYSSITLVYTHDATANTRPQHLVNMSILLTHIQGTCLIHPNYITGYRDHLESFDALGQATHPSLKTVESPHRTDTVMEAVTLDLDQV